MPDCRDHEPRRPLHQQQDQQRQLTSSSAAPPSAPAATPNPATTQPPFTESQNESLYPFLFPHAPPQNDSLYRLLAPRVPLPAPSPLWPQSPSMRQEHRSLSDILQEALQLTTDLSSLPLSEDVEAEASMWRSRSRPSSEQQDPTEDPDLPPQ